MNRRSFMQTFAAGTAAVLARPRLLDAQLPEAKVTKIRIFDPVSRERGIFNQSSMVILVDTDIGITPRR